MAITFKQNNLFQSWPFLTMAPGDPVAMYVNVQSLSPDEVEDVRHELGLDRSFLCLIKIRPHVKSETYAPFSRLRLRRKNAKLRGYAPCSHLPRLSRHPCDPDDVSAPGRSCH